MQFLRANTQVVVTVGPFVDVGDGFTPETGITLGAADEAELVKHGTTTGIDISGRTWGVLSTAVDGYYNLTLTTGDTDTEGMLLVVVQDDSVCLPVKAEYMVLAEAAYDSMFTAKDDGFMDVNIKTVGRADTQETEANNLESACANYTAQRGLTGTAVPDVAADGAFGLPISDAGGLDLDAKLANTNEITAARMAELDGANMPSDIDAIVTNSAAILSDTGDLNDTKILQTLNLTASGNIGIDWANVENQASVVDLSATDIQLCDTITTYTGNTLQTADVASLNDIAAADVWAVDATTQQTQGTFGQAVGDPGATAKSLWEAVVSDAAGVSVSADVIAVKAETALIVADTDELQTDDVPGLIAALNDPDAATVAAAVWDLDATSHQTLGTFGQAIGDPAANSETIYDAVVTDAAGTNVAADIVAVKAETSLIVGDTNELQTDDVPALIAALNDVSTAEVLTQVNAALDTAISELGVAAPTATPTLRTGLMLLYMALRNRLDVNTTAAPDELRIYNNAGTIIAQKDLTDDGTDYSEAKMASG